MQRTVSTRPYCALPPAGWTWWSLRSPNCYPGPENLTWEGGAERITSKGLREWGTGPLPLFWVTKMSGGCADLHAFFIQQSASAHSPLLQPHRTGRVTLRLQTVTIQGCSYYKRRSEDIKASNWGSSFIVFSDSQDLTRSWGFLLYEIGHTLGKLLERICKPRVLVSWTKFEKQRCGLRSAMNSLDKRPFNIGKFLGPRDNVSSQRSALNVWMNVQSESDILSIFWHLAWVCAFAVLCVFFIV